MSTHPASYRIAQAIGLSGAAWLSGNIAALSLIAVPALVETQNETPVPTSIIVKLWHSFYNKGKTQNPPIAAATATAFLYLAWSVRAGGPLFRPTTYNLAGFYSTAAVLTVSIVPFTIATMRKTNNALMSLAQSSKDLSAAEETQSSDLLKRWVFLNGIRSLLPLVGAAVGMAAAWV
ncbi:DUF1772-domain-containing protein [Aspergillus sclerotioniger CBS 115572]|uniref:DUF1772-domain-containing protein n=1 Tax=Aspergillus sclerotioniger CBS 115572 TaxID=1450535 RepID=A0A317WWV5_9EURO|nr:DUF1772-domain-containing protein [Aspergillus sclerotioniger CBS 115572]PWY90381.1 DUF1772-domain-containing protein [Aspergillus sclerotioniger CBS 115572]